MESNVSHKEFGARTKSTEAAKAFSEQIRGKIILVTGISPKSIGEGVALALAAHRPDLLILASRTLSKIQAVTHSIHVSHAHVKIQEVVVDLSSLKSVRAAAESCREILGNEGRRLDVLFNNAGINISERRLTEEGVEMQFATNHLGPFLLTNLLLPFMNIGRGGARVINTSSEAHRISPVRFSDINQTPGAKVEFEDQPRRGMPEGTLRGDGGYEPSIAYGQSKTATILFAVGLNSRGVKSFAVMPGTIATDLVRGMDEAGLKSLNQGNFDWKSIDEGAATLVVAGFDPGLNDEVGVYLDDCHLKRPSKWASDPVKAEKLWALSEKMVGERFGQGNVSRL
ncbi:NAD(P)-binding protein [Hyaloscypha variabilis F]|uniref:NAD(P)-binding protein n=1 Tax=Hyaloscypha variabilis (strain UAMH 11265 / GT02V1 / F) TaxID=1149755 RepID=A0A2J6RXX3_HYAVF|nr:NAD(P)-binding protein [Hyaloscypha variabilis F]